LGMDWIPPELREDAGEIEAAQKRTLPKLVELKDIKGDFHCHSDWDGGEDSIEEMANQAVRLGYKYLGISDHAQFLKIEKGLDEKNCWNRINILKRLTRSLLVLRFFKGWKPIS